MSRNERLNLNILFYSVVASTPSMSGGVRILIECARRWAKECTINVFTSEEGHELCRRYGLNSVNYVVMHTPFRKYFVFASVLVRTVKAIAAVYRQIPVRGTTIIYSSSAFWADQIPAIIIRRRSPNIKWISSFYLFPPSLLRGFGKRWGFGLFDPRSLFYNLQTRVAQWLIKKYGDMVFVTNDLDRYRFIDYKNFTPDKVVAVRGGVDTKTPLLVPDSINKEFSAVFVGRLHPQKGVSELIDIWRHVCKVRKDAKLAMIGNGPLEGQIRKKIRKYGLESNVTMLGFMDGIEKIRIFKQSKIVVHPAIYDSGGMAPAEAMACGLPGVSFDLQALRDYYPKGMIKTPRYDLELFASNVIRLLEDKHLYHILQKEAFDFAQEWDWDERADQVLHMIRRMLNAKSN